MNVLNSNNKTLHSYEGRIQEYIDGTSKTVYGAAKDWIDAALCELSRESDVLELGSAFGRDAAYIVSKGFKLECTDAVDGFVSHLRAEGFNARLYNAITDRLTAKYDLILANAVMLHFNRSEFASVLRKMFCSLKSGGRFAFSLKTGEGEGWSREKIEGLRFFCFWKKDDLPPFLIQAGFTQWTIVEASTQRAHAEWLFVIARNNASP